MSLISCKIELKPNGQSIVFCLQLALIMIILIIILMVIILFLLSKTQNHMFLLQL